MKKIKQIPLQLRDKRRPIDVSFKVWKDLMKTYNREDARMEYGEESIQAFKFGHKIISNSLDDFYILLVHD